VKKLVLAEKPSVGRELARVLGCRNCGKYFEGESYVVTWALGHLITPAPPDFYGQQYRRWSLSTLPILPETLENIVIEKTKQQYELVAGLMGREDIQSLIIATDAGREGELVARWIIQMAHCSKPLERLWISSQTDSAIKEGFENLKSGEQYYNLYQAAGCRSAADWYVGYNVSRAMSCFYDTPMSAGRVQTPTLALMVNREHEINSFTGKFYWTIKADFGSFFASLFKDGTIKLPSEQEANDIATKLADAQGSVNTLSEEIKTQQPPLAYDLTELQQDANTSLGFSAKETLDILQRLYEVHKIVTYPRTDSRYITHDIVATIPQRLAALTGTSFGLRAMRFQENGYRIDNERFVVDSMVSDHHALLPTEQKVDLSKLNEKERQLWELIIMRFLEVLSPDYCYKTTTVTAQVSGEVFISRLTIPQNLGWREVGRDINRASTCVIDEDVLESRTSQTMELKEGDPLRVVSTQVKRFSTPAPSRYTEATLLYAMEHAGKFVDDAQQKKHLANGLGTPATRADIIEKLIFNRCIERQDRYLVPTPKGMELVRLVPQQLQSPELTAVWEERLALISSGEESPENFIADVKSNARELVNQVVASKLKYDPALMGEKTCPFCGWPMIRIVDEYGQIHNVCQRFSCGYEEKEVKVKEPVQQPESKAFDSAGTEHQTDDVAVKKVRAVASATADPLARKKIVIRKSALKKEQPDFIWKTTLEVVKPSHYHPRHERDLSSRRGNNAPSRRDHDFSRKPKSSDASASEKTQRRSNTEGKRREDSKPFTPRPSSTGGTFADFLAIQKKREQRDLDRRKKK
jgi:DNA topoisomerase-3